MKDQLLTEIIKEVSENGFYYVPLELLHPVFVCEGKEYLSADDRLFIWAVENRILYEFKEVGEHTVVRFMQKWGQG